MIIKIFHFLIILLIVIVPFINTKKYIVLKAYYLVLIPAIWIHWYLSFGYCSLTLLDNYLSGKDLYSTDGFVNKLLEPIFLFPKDKPFIINNVIWVVSITLWFKVLYDFLKNDYENLKYLHSIITTTYNKQY